MIKKIIQKLVNPKILSWSKDLYLKSKILLYSIRYPILFDAIRNRHIVVFHFMNPKRHEIFNIINKIKNENKLLLNDNESYQIFMATKRKAKIGGDVAEVGVYRGGSAKLICEAKGDTPLYLFDTFEGIPKVDAIDAPQFYEGQYAESLENVKCYLSKYKKVYFYKGIFPKTGDSIKNKKFSFVHLDVDTYESTLNCLRFFYSRMCKGGIIISHDCVSPGVKKAFNEFFKNKSEPIFDLPGGMQCLMIKI